MSNGIKKEFLIEGLDCANCALKIEKEINSLPEIKSACVDFVLKKLTIEVESNSTHEDIAEKVCKTARKVENDINIFEKTQQEYHKEDKRKFEFIRHGLGAALFLLALLFKFGFWAELTMYLASYVLVGGSVLLKALRNITRGQVFDENFLMSIATIGAFSIHQFPEAVAVMLFYQVGELFQEIAVNHSRKSISALMDIRPDFANLKSGDEIKKVSPGEVGIGDIIIVKPGEKIPLDGKVTEGKSVLDTSALTGEAYPREVEVGDEVLSGSINKNGLLSIEVTKEFGESTVSKIIELVQNASSKKAQTENFITKFARYYTPVVVFVAVALAVIPPLALPGAAFSDWLYRALVFLVVSCPCALVISIPLGFFGGIGGASRNGILIKGSSYLEALNNVDTVVFDKTGTLTKGVFKVTKVTDYNKASGIDILECAAFAESYSNHPIALSIIKAYGKEVDRSEIGSYNEIPGCGIKVMARGKEILAGNTKLMAMEGITFEEAEEAVTTVYIAVGGKYAGYIEISDEIKDDSPKAVKLLRAMGVRKLVMLTGDSKPQGEKISRQLGLDEVYAGLLPHQKVEMLEMLDRQKASKGKLLFAGDGINDAPVLARSDIGVAMGCLGSDAAIEAADVVLMTDEVSKLVNAIKIAKRTRNIVWQNIIFAMSIKAIVLLLGAGGIATIWEAVFADVGVTVLAVLNSMRVLEIK